MMASYPEFKPFNYGARIGQAENILASQQRRDPNSMTNQLYAAKIRDIDNPNPLSGSKPASNIQYDVYRLNMIEEIDAGRRPEKDLQRFDNWVAREKVIDIGNVPTAYSGGQSTPLSTEQYEGDAAAFKASQVQLGKQSAQGGGGYGAPL